MPLDGLYQRALAADTESMSRLRASLLIVFVVAVAAAGFVVIRFFEFVSHAN